MEQTTDVPKTNTKKFNPLLLIFAAIVVFLLAATTYLIYQNLMFQRQITTLTQTPSPSPFPSEKPLSPTAIVSSPTPQADEMANWKTYTDQTYKFQLKYPDTYKITEDKTGWPKAILILYKGGQSYDLVVEVWDNEADYKTKYANNVASMIVYPVGNKFLTLRNQNNNAEVNKIIATFKEL